MPASLDTAGARLTPRGAAPTASRASRVVRASAHTAPSAHDADASVSLGDARAASRRAFALGLGSAALAAFAVPTRAALAVRAPQVCDPTEAGAECRAKLLIGDEAELGGYEAKSQKKFVAAAASTNPDLTNYQKDTLALVEEVEAVLALDIYDLTREKRISGLKKDGNTWSSSTRRAGPRRRRAAEPSTTPSTRSAGTSTRTASRPCPPPGRRS
jgi:hypothetical protein